MNLQESIRRIIKEETSLKNKLLNSIDDIGILKTARKVAGLKNLMKILEDKFLTRQIRIQTISEIVSDYTERQNEVWMVEDDIVITDNNEYFTRIELLNPNSAVAYVYEKPEFDEGDEYDIYYEDMDRKLLDRIFNEVIEYYIYKGF